MQLFPAPRRPLWPLTWLLPGQGQGRAKHAELRVTERTRMALYPIKWMWVAAHTGFERSHALVSTGRPDPARPGNSVWAGAGAGAGSGNESWDQLSRMSLCQEPQGWNKTQREE